MRALALVLLFSAFPLTALAQGDPCAPNPCTFPPPDECVSSTTLRQYEPVGTCVNLGGGNVGCSYNSSLIDCSESGGTCVGAQCVSAPSVPWFRGWGIALGAGLLMATAALAIRRRHIATPGT